LLDANAGTPWELACAAGFWLGRPPRSDDDLGTAVSTGWTTSDSARQDVLERMGSAKPVERRQLLVRHMRMTVQPALRVLQDLLGLSELAASQLSVEDVAQDGSSVRIDAVAMAASQAAQAVVLRQRLHALVVGQRLDEQMLAYDGARITLEQAPAWQEPTSLAARWP
jgi:hypothetical protein